MKKVRWGIIGTGFIANKFAGAVCNACGGELTAVASRTEASAKAFAEKHGIAKFFSSYEEMIESDTVDAVYIALPHEYHAEYIKKCIAADKHILCEKPITVNEKELSEIEALLEDKNVFLMEAMWTRFLPAIAEIKRIIESGAIGKVLEVSADFCYDSPDRSHHVFNENRAGGSLLDVGVYGLNFASIFLGDDVADIKTAAFLTNGIDDRLNVFLTYESGAIARFSSAIMLHKPDDGYIYGSRGYIYVPHFYAAEEFEIVTNEGAERKKYTVPFKGNGFEEEIEECNRCILSGEKQSSVMPLAQSRTDMRLMDAIRAEAGVVYDND